MKQAILNLLLNAVQAMPKGGRLALKGRVPEGNRWVQLSIQDSGVGIPGEDIDKLFNPFFSTREGGSASASPSPIGSSTSTMERSR